MLVAQFYIISLLSIFYLYLAQLLFFQRILFLNLEIDPVLAVDWDDGAVLLERAVPGDVLRAMDRNEAMEIYANTIKQWQQCTHNHSGSYRHCGEWLDAMDGMDEQGIEKRLVDFARELQTLLCHEKMEEKFVMVICI